MDIGRKMNLVRTLKGWSQEEMAEKLNMSVTGYAKIERGETKLHIPRLEKIAEVLGIEVKELFEDNQSVSVAFNNKHIQNVQNIQCYQAHVNSAIELTQELEKSRLLVEQKDKQLDLLMQQLEQLKEIIALMKAK